MGLERENHYNRFIPSRDQNSAYILGAIFGDGCACTINRENKGNHGIEKLVELKAKEKEFAESFEEALSNAGLHAYTSRNENSWEVSCYSRSLVDWFNEFNIEKVREFTSEDRLFFSFVRGLYESDGSICRPKKESCKRRGTGWRSGVQLRIYSVNKQLLDFVKEGLEHRGIHTKVYDLGRKSGGFREKRKKTLWGTVTSGVKHIKKFLEEVNPCIKNDPWKEN